jgi:hypothetical protein
MTPDELQPLISETSGGVLLPCWVQPKSSRDAVAGLYGDAVKIAITAPPVDGKANAHLCKFIAKQAGLPKSSVDLDSGHTSRRKVLRLKGISRNGLIEKLCGE